MDDLIYRQVAIDELKRSRALFCDNTPATFSRLSYGDKCRVDEIDNAIAVLVNMPSAQPSEYTQVAFEQGRIQGHVEMRTELLMQLKEIVGDEVWANI